MKTCSFWRDWLFRIQKSSGWESLSNTCCIVAKNVPESLSPNCQVFNGSLPTSNLHQNTSSRHTISEANSDNVCPYLVWHFTTNLSFANSSCLSSIRQLFEWALLNTKVVSNKVTLQMSFKSVS